MNLIDVHECDRHCSDNHNTPNMCYCEMTGGYRTCNPQDHQCDFYIKSLEKLVLKKNDNKVYILQRLNFDDEVEQSWAIEGFDKAVEVTRKLAFEWDTAVIRTCKFHEELVKEQLRQAHEYFSNLKIKLDGDREWRGYLGRPSTTWVLRELDVIQ